MNAALGRDVSGAIAKARTNVPKLARATGLSESWIKQVKTGRIDQPRAAWLERLAVEVGADPAKWLALSSQLGAAAAESRPTGQPSELVAALNRQSNVIEALVVLLARREGITLHDLDETEQEILGRVLQGGIRTATTEAIEPDPNPDPEEPQPLDRRRLSPLPAKP